MRDLYSMKNLKLPKIASEGYIFIIIFAAITLFITFFSNTLGILSFVLTLWCVYFFRDPDRVTPQNPSLVIAPADGIITAVDYVTPPTELALPNEEMLRIAIFMNVLNVHVNRSPFSGVIEKIVYFPGKFFNASLDKSSIYNERQSFVLNTDTNQKIAFVQIAGFIARRIVKFVDEGDTIKSGEKFGLIRFGSRVDVYLPKELTPLVFKGQTATGGETILADFNYKGAQVTSLVLDKPLR